MNGARRVRAEEYETEWFSARARELCLEVVMHRKVWEYCALAQAFIDIVDLNPELQQYGLGFGVGREPLVAWFANRGARILATDSPHPGVWVATGQYASSIDDLRRDDICDRDAFESRVSLETLSMNDIPQGLYGRFDFTWSTSCFEHLGGVEYGLRFFCEQMKCLTPGGVALHVTELNTSLNATETLNNGDLCFFRASDFLQLERMLRAQGDILLPIDLEQGARRADLHVDRAPYSLPHLNVSLGGYTTTSVLLIAIKG